MPKVPDRQNLDNKIRQHMSQSAQNWSDFMSTLNVFQNNVNRRNFTLAEAERLQLHTLLDDYVDHYTMAGQLIAEHNKGQME